MPLFYTLSWDLLYPPSRVVISSLPSVSGQGTPREGSMSPGPYTPLCIHKSQSLPHGLKGTKILLHIIYFKML